MVLKACTISLVLISIIVLSTSCGGYNDIAKAPPFDDSCPDTYVSVNETFLSSGISEEGLPLGIATVFSPDTEVIYATFVLSADLCCIALTVEWKYEGERIGELWSGEGTTMENSIFSVPLNMPEAGFFLGNYTVTLYSSVWGDSVPFTIR